MPIAQEVPPLPEFRQRFPWIGPDLQTLRNTLRRLHFPPETSPLLEFPLAPGERLVGRLDVPARGDSRGDGPLGLVLVLHGLGGGSDDPGQRRLGLALTARGFAVLRLNLRGAGPGRPLARGTYAARCTADLLPVLQECRRLAADLAPAGGSLPLAAVGLSLGGTVLLNALLDGVGCGPPLLDALVCISSPLDLPGCADRFESPRNRLYQGWLVRRLIAQTLADPHGLTDPERRALTGPDRPATIRAFDARITAPRWGFPGVMAYYEASSPLQRLRLHLGNLPPLLLLHARDDPWVPVAPTLSLGEELATLQRHGERAVGRPPQVWITASGGHNGFHAPGDTASGCWSDRFATQWLRQALGPLRLGSD